MNSSFLAEEGDPRTGLWEDTQSLHWTHLRFLRRWSWKVQLQEKFAIRLPTELSG